MDMKFISILCILIFAFSCKNNQDKLEIVSDKNTDSLVVTKEDISKIRYTDYLLDSRVKTVIVNWTAYKQLVDIIENIKKSDINFFINNKKELLELLVSLKQNVPMEINNASVLSRISALETKLLKFESLANLSTTRKAELLINIEDILVAFSNLNLQMNKKIEIDNIIIERP